LRANSRGLPLITKRPTAPNACFAASPEEQGPFASVGARRNVLREIVFFANGPRWFRPRSAFKARASQSRPPSIPPYGPGHRAGKAEMNAASIGFQMRGFAHLPSAGKLMRAPIMSIGLVVEFGPSSTIRKTPKRGRALSPGMRGVMRSPKFCDYLPETSPSEPTRTGRSKS